MARGTHDRRSRGEIKQTVDRRKQEYGEKTDSLKHDADDIGIEHSAFEEMEAIGTEEGMEEVTACLHEAEDTSVKEFAEDGNALQEAQQEGQEFEGELNERAHATEGDRQKIGDARQQMHGDNAATRVEQAENQTREDIEFLRGEEERGRESRETAEQEHEQLKQIVHGSGG